MNGGDGIFLLLGAGLLVDAGNTVTENHGFGLNCSGSEASFQGSLVLSPANTAGGVSGTCSGF